MKKLDVTCPECKAGYRRIEVIYRRVPPGEFRCLVCNRLLDTFDGAVEVGFRLTVQPERILR
jgi:transposase-like protein